MNNENTKRIIDACPSLFIDIEQQCENMQNGIMFTPIVFGFECGDGWADLLVELCQKINTHLKTLSKEQVDSIYALQIKEKYGTLRFYLSCYDDTIDKFIQDAQLKSSFTCEVCGNAGKVLGEHWLYCACPEHSRE
ncbi:MAG: hypothetical protein ACK5GV_01105 [Bacteroidota bacterium]|jgi:hypothetical protein